MICMRPFFVNDTATTEIYTLSLHDALPICALRATPRRVRALTQAVDGARPVGHLAASRRSYPLAPRHGLRAARSEEHTSELQSRQYLVCRLLLEKKNIDEASAHSQATQTGR